MRKLIVVLLFVLALAAVATAQDYVHSTYDSKPWEIGAWGGYGNGVGKSGDWRFIEGGMRFGKVLTHEIGSGALRGNLEFSGDVMPLFLVRQPEIVQTVAPIELTAQSSRTNPLFMAGPGVSFVRTGRAETIYGGGFNPFVLRWNFTRGKKIVPFFGANGGVLFTTKDMPQPDSSAINFMSGAEFGAHFFRSEKRAITFSGHVLHVSNASIGNHNPGLNTTLHFRLGYTWFK